MKKIITAAMLAFVLTLCACGGQPAQTTAEADVTTTEAAEEQTAEENGDYTLYTDFT